MAVNAGPLTLYAFAAYLLLISLIGILATRFSSKGIAHYFIGGRKMGMLVVAMSAVVSGRSGWLLLGVTGMSYMMGLSAIWAVLGYTLAEWFLFLYYAPAIRRFSEKNDCITLTDFFSARFQDKKGLLRITVAVITLVFMVAYVSAQFVAGGKAFDSSFQTGFSQGLILTAVIILFYTAAGGFLAVSLTDTIQGFFMLFALVALPFMAIVDAGGPGTFIREAAPFNQGQFFNPTALGFGAAAGFLGIGLGSAGNPHIVARYMSIKDPGKFRMVAIIGTLANIILALGAITTGLLARFYYPDTGLLPAGDPENVYPLLASAHLPPILFGVVIASVFAAIMSTADSQLLVGASAVVRDLYEKKFSRGREINQKQLVRLSRFMVLGMVIVSAILGLMAQNLVFWLVLFAWAGLGAAFGPTSILALFWKGTTLRGVLSGMISGALCVIIWNRVPFLSSFVYELIPAFFLSLAVTWIVSKFDKHKPNTP